MAKRKRTSRNRNNSRGRGAPNAHVAPVVPATSMPRGIVPGLLGTVGLLAVGTVELAATVLTTAVRGAVTVAKEAVGGVWAIGSDVVTGGRMTRPSRASVDERDDMRHAA